MGTIFVDTTHAAKTGARTGAQPFVRVIHALNLPSFRRTNPSAIKTAARLPSSLPIRTPVEFVIKFPI